MWLLSHYGFLHDFFKLINFVIKIKTTVLKRFLKSKTNNHES